VAAPRWRPPRCKRALWRGVKRGGGAVAKAAAAAVGGAGGGARDGIAGEHPTRRRATKRGRETGRRAADGDREERVPRDPR